MPGWHEATHDARTGQDVQFIGIAQEQHGDRARLFMQWKQMEWPVMVDSLNILGVRAVPITLLIDEDAVIVATARRPQEIDTLLQRQSVERRAIESWVPDLAGMKTSATTAADHRTIGDATFLFGSGWDSAASSYRRALKIDPADAVAAFRLGVTLRRRYETSRRRGTDFGAAIDAWRDALDQDPNNYIWRRRIQQYGPALAKPYPFYSWIERAKREITRRDEIPTHLSAPLTGSESLSKASFVAQDTEPENPDPNGEITVDEKQWIRIETAAAPATGRADSALRIHVALRPDAKRQIRWNNEAEPLRVWFDTPDGWKIDRSLTIVPNPHATESGELRRFEVELLPPEGTTRARLCGYALYNVCEASGGTCRHLRQNFVVELRAGQK